MALPVYIVVAVNFTDWLRREYQVNVLVELVVFVGLGILWALPLKAVFKGVGQADPDAVGNDNMPDGRS